MPKVPSLRAWRLHFFVGLSFCLTLLGCAADEVDVATLCPITGAEAKTVLLVDIDEVLNPKQTRAFDQFTKSLTSHGENPDGSLVPSRNYVPKDHMLVVYEMNAEGRTPEVKFRMCNPGSEEDRGFFSRPAKIPPATRAKWDQFTQTAEELVAASITSSTDDPSPLIESLQFIRDAEFPVVSDASDGEARDPAPFYVISDMLQNSPDLSHFDELPPFRQLPASLALNLEDVDIRVHYLQSERYAEFQSPNHVGWWIGLLSDSGSAMTRKPVSW